ncbi:MAG: carboxymuconolactone decarboxylase family protein [Paracoccaceae bacterium]
MNDAKNPFAAMMEQVQEMAKSFPQMNAFDPKAMEAMWPTMPKDAMEAMFGNAFNENGLDAKTRLLITLAGLTMQGAQNPSAMRQTVKHAREAGAHDQQILETLGMMSLFAGVPAMTRAMEIARDVMGDDETGDDA